jgi:tRNA-Thr(GGU) m(6)t(6)A37 methyltransferase TsaA
MSQSITFEPIGYIATPFQQKFAIPRQAGLVDVPGRIKFIAPFNQEAAFKGLEQVSHIWVSFIFHQHLDAKQKLSVRPPRFGGNTEFGVFATRSSFRPNQLGLSLLKIIAIEKNAEGVALLVSGVDMLDGTPIVDIKPYLPYAAIEPNAVNDLAAKAPQEKLSVIWQNDVLSELEHIDELKQQKAIIEQLIALDPRPAFHSDKATREYRFNYAGFDIAWQFQNLTATITALTKM